MNFFLSSVGEETILPRPEKIYVPGDGKPILHKTVIEIVTERQVATSMTRSWDFDLQPDCEADQIQVKLTFPALLYYIKTKFIFKNLIKFLFQVSGSVVGPLKVSLTREQYQQLLETIDNLFTKIPESFDSEVATQTKLGDIQEEESDSMFGVSTLSLDPTLRARMLNSSSAGPPPKQLNTVSQALSLRGLYIFLKLNYRDLETRIIAVLNWQSILHQILNL